MIDFKGVRSKEYIMTVRNLKGMKINYFSATESFFIRGQFLYPKLMRSFLVLHLIFKNKKVIQCLV